MIHRFLTEEEGATSIEYGLIASLVFLVIINAMTAVGNANSANYELITNAVAGASP